MKPKYLIFISPFLLLGEFYFLSWITELLRQQSDIAVTAGVVLSCIFIVGNYFLINYLIFTIKNKFKNEKSNSIS